MALKEHSQVPSGMSLSPESGTGGRRNRGRHRRSGSFVPNLRLFQRSEHKITGQTDTPKPPKYNILNVTSLFDANVAGGAVPTIASAEISQSPDSQKPQHDSLETLLASSPQDRYRAFAEHPQRLHFFLSAVVPRLLDMTEENQAGHTSGDKWKYFAGLTEAYSIVEAIPDLDGRLDAVAQSNRANGEQLWLIEDAMPSIEEDKRRIFAETEDFGAQEMQPLISQSKRAVEDQLGQLNIRLEVEKQAPPSPLVKDLAQMNAMIQIFRADGFEHVTDHRELAELQQDTDSTTNSKKRIRRKEKKEIINRHIDGLLSAYVVSTGKVAEDDIEVLPYYRERFTQLQTKIEASNVHLEEELPDYTRAQQIREIITAVNNFDRFTKTATIEKESGITEAVKRDSNSARKRENAISWGYAGAVELPQVASGWVGGSVVHITGVRDLLALGIIAGSTRLASLGILALKGIQNEGLVTKTGVATDPGSKWSKEHLGKAWPGFVAFNGVIELLFLGDAALGLPGLGMAGALAIEASTNLSPWGLPRQILEVTGIKKVKDRKKKEKVGDHIVSFNLPAIQRNDSDPTMTEIPDQSDPPLPNSIVMQPGEEVRLLEPV